LKDLRSLSSIPPPMPPLFMDQESGEPSTVRPPPVVTAPPPGDYPDATPEVTVLNDSDRPIVVRPQTLYDKIRHTLEPGEVVVLEDDGGWDE